MVGKFVEDDQVIIDWEEQSRWWCGRFNLSEDGKTELVFFVLAVRMRRENKRRCGRDAK